MARKKKALLGGTYHVRLTEKQEDWLNENLKDGEPISLIIREALNLYITSREINSKYIENKSNLE